MLFKKFLHLVLTAAVSLPSFSTPAWADGEASPQTLRYRQIMRDSSETLRGLPQKIVTHPVGKAGKAVAWKFGIAAMTTIAMLAANDIKKQFDQEKIEATQENFEKRAKEFEEKWDMMENATYSAADTALVLYPIATLAEKLVSWKIPALAAKKIGGQLLHSFIIGLVLSSTESFADQMINLTCEYMFTHPETVGDLTREEKIEIYLLQKRLNVSYLTYGILNGNPARKKAFTKVVETLHYILWNDSDTGAILLSNATRDFWLNGKTMVTFASVFASIPIKQKVVPQGARFPVIKGTILSITMATVISYLIPEIYEDKLTILSRINWTKTYSDQLKKLEAVKTEIEAREILDHATVQRQNTVNMALSAIKLANDRIERLVAEQKLSKAPLEGYGQQIKEYQEAIVYGFDVIIHNYVEDQKLLLTVLQKNPSLWLSLSPEVQRLNGLESWMRYFKDIIVSQYKASDPQFARDKTYYTEARRKLDRLVLWNFFEKDIRLLQK